MSANAQVYSNAKVYDHAHVCGGADTLSWEAAIFHILLGLKDRPAYLPTIMTILRELHKEEADNWQVDLWADLRNPTGDIDSGYTIDDTDWDHGHHAWINFLGRTINPLQEGFWRATAAWEAVMNARPDWDMSQAGYHNYREGWSRDIKHLAKRAADGNDLGNCKHLAAVILFMLPRQLSLLAKMYDGLEAGRTLRDGLSRTPLTGEQLVLQQIWRAMGLLYFGNSGHGDDRAWYSLSDVRTGNVQGRPHYVHPVPDHNDDEIPF